MNYLLVRSMVFHSRERHVRTLPRFMITVVALGVVSYSLIVLWSEHFGWPVIVCKILAEGLLFIVGFLVQRSVVFRAERT